MMIRLNKLLSQRALCSRREADQFIQAGLVRVNGSVVRDLGSKVPEDADIEFLRSAIRKKSNQVTILLNKPIGYVSAQPEKGYEPAVRLITVENFFGPPKEKLSNEIFKKLAVAGRLDIDSKGLLILTQDGALAKTLIGENSKIEKEYLVRFQGEWSETKQGLLTHGLILDERPLKPVKVEMIESQLLRMTLVEGRKRQIRRMLDLVGLKVISLKRTRIGKIRLGNLPEGRWRFKLDSEEF